MASVFWPDRLHELWEQILPCVDCRRDPELERKINWDQYVPLKTVGLLPPGARGATFMLVAAEPSGAPNVKDREQSIARQRLTPGVRNFAGTRADLALHFAIEQWLIDRKKGESYYLTDLAKCRVPTGSVAIRTAERRYANCVKWLEHEIAILKPRAVIAVGRPAFSGLVDQRRPHWPAVFEISHYGKAGVAHWKKYEQLPGWDKGLPELKELESFGRDFWHLALHKRTFDEEIGHYPPMYRWLLAAYRYEMTAIRRLLEQVPFATTGAKALKLEGPRRMRVFNPVAPD